MCLVCTRLEPLSFMPFGPLQYICGTVALHVHESRSNTNNVARCLCSSLCRSNKLLYAQYSSSVYHLSTYTLSSNACVLFLSNSRSHAYHTHTCVSDYAFVNIWCLTRGLATIWKRDWDISTVPWVYSGRITVWYCTCSVHARFSDSTLLFSGIVSLRNSYMCSFSTSPTPHPLFSGNPTQAVPGQQPPE